ncbi:MAG: TetR/AcrR family transcriptional regulator [Nocardioidaceae bacterium]
MFDVDPSLRDAAIAVLAETGWDGFTLERVADVVGVSRSTLWRQGVSRDSLIAGLVSELAEDFQSSMYPVLTTEGTGRERLELSLAALCDVLDRHLPLMLATDEAFHQAPAPGQQPIYLGPFIQFLREGAADGTLSPGSDGPELVDVADVLMNGVAWTYTHLRGRHGWAAKRARPAIIGLMVRGLLPNPTLEV